MPLRVALIECWRSRLWTSGPRQEPGSDRVASWHCARGRPSRMSIAPLQRPVAGSSSFPGGQGP
eukprot:5968383-Lingulodinium_polyedra.AAC.1